MQYMPFGGLGWGKSSKGEGFGAGGGGGGKEREMLTGMHLYCLHFVISLLCYQTQPLSQRTQRDVLRPYVYIATKWKVLLRVFCMDTMIQRKDTQLHRP